MNGNWKKLKRQSERSSCVLILHKVKFEVLQKKKGMLLLTVETGSIKTVLLLKKTVEEEHCFGLFPKFLS